MTKEADISRKYRALGAEEPPRALDEAILAAARREAGAGPASLQARGRRQRWYAPLATAAVLVLAVAVTLNMQLERPGIESPAPQPVQQRDAQPSAAEAADAKQELKLKATADLKLAPKPAAEADARARRKEAGQAASGQPPAAPAQAAPPAVREPQPFAGRQLPERAASRADDARESRVPASSVTGEAARQMEGRISRDLDAAERAPQMGAIQALAKRAERAEAQARTLAGAPADTPERELERIAELRTQGRHDEADKALAEFRKRRPEFRIPDALRERVERR